MDRTFKEELQHQVLLVSTENIFNTESTLFLDYVM